MTKSIVVAALLSAIAAGAFAQASAPAADAAASKPKHPHLAKLKAKARADRASEVNGKTVNPETSADKKGGQ